MGGEGLQGVSLGRSCGSEFLCRMGVKIQGSDTQGEIERRPGERQLGTCGMVWCPGRDFSKTPKVACFVHLEIKNEYLLGVVGY